MANHPGKAPRAPMIGAKADLKPLGRVIGLLCRDYPAMLIITMLCIIISAFLSFKSLHGMCTSISLLVRPRSSTMVGTTPIVIPPAALVAFATQAISPRSQPPKTMVCPCSPAHLPSASVAEKYSLAILLFAEQNIHSFIILE